MLAVAANFSGAMERLAAAYEKETGAQVQTVYSATGKLYAQIKNGAPYDIFLAADGQFLRQALSEFLTRFRGTPLPRVWTM